MLDECWKITCFIILITAVNSKQENLHEYASNLQDQVVLQPTDDLELLLPKDCLEVCDDSGCLFFCPEPARGVKRCAPSGSTLGKSLCCSTDEPLSPIVNLPSHVDLPLPAPTDRGNPLRIALPALPPMKTLGSRESKKALKINPSLTARLNDVRNTLRKLKTFHQNVRRKNNESSQKKVDNPFVQPSPSNDIVANLQDSLTEYNPDDSSKPQETIENNLILGTQEDPTARTFPGPSELLVDPSEELSKNNMEDHDVHETEEGSPEVLQKETVILPILNSDEETLDNTEMLSKIHDTPISPEEINEFLHSVEENELKADLIRKVEPNLSSDVGYTVNNTPPSEFLQMDVPNSPPDINQLVFLSPPDNVTSPEQPPLSVILNSGDNPSITDSQQEHNDFLLSENGMEGKKGSMELELQEVEARASTSGEHYPANHNSPDEIIKMDQLSEDFITPPENNKNQLYILSSPEGPENSHNIGISTLTNNPIQKEHDIEQTDKWISNVFTSDKSGNEYESPFHEQLDTDPINVNSQELTMDLGEKNFKNSPRVEDTFIIGTEHPGRDRAVGLKWRGIPHATSNDALHLVPLTTQVNFQGAVNSETSNAEELPEVENNAAHSSSRNTPELNLFNNENPVSPTESTEILNIGPVELFYEEPLRNEKTEKRKQIINEAENQVAVDTNKNRISDLSLNRVKDVSDTYPAEQLTDGNREPIRTMSIVPRDTFETDSSGGEEYVPVKVLYDEPVLNENTVDHSYDSETSAKTQHSTECDTIHRLPDNYDLEPEINQLRKKGIVDREIVVNNRFQDYNQPDDKSMITSTMSPTTYEEYLFEDDNPNKHKSLIPLSQIIETQDFNFLENINQLSISNDLNKVLSEKMNERRSTQNDNNKGIVNFMHKMSMMEDKINKYLGENNSKPFDKQPKDLHTLQTKYPPLQRNELLGHLNENYASGIQDDSKKMLRRNVNMKTIKPSEASPFELNDNLNDMLTKSSAELSAGESLFQEHTQVAFNNKDPSTDESTMVFIDDLKKTKLPQDSNQEPINEATTPTSKIETSESQTFKATDIDDIEDDKWYIIQPERQYYETIEDASENENPNSNNNSQSDFERSKSREGGSVKQKSNISGSNAIIGNENISDLLDSSAFKITNNINDSEIKPITQPNNDVLHNIHSTDEFEDMQQANENKADNYNNSPISVKDFKEQSTRTRTSTSDVQNTGTLIIQPRNPSDVTSDFFDIRIEPSIDTASNEHSSSPISHASLSINTVEYEEQTQRINSILRDSELNKNTPPGHSESELSSETRNDSLYETVERDVQGNNQVFKGHIPSYSSESHHISDYTLNSNKSSQILYSINDESDKSQPSDTITWPSMPIDRKDTGNTQEDGDAINRMQNGNLEPIEIYYEDGFNNLKEGQITSHNLEQEQKIDSRFSGMLRNLELVNDTQEKQKEIGKNENKVELTVTNDDLSGNDVSKLLNTSQNSDYHNESPDAHVYMTTTANLFPKLIDFFSHINNKSNIPSDDSLTTSEKPMSRAESEWNDWVSSASRSVRGMFYATGQNEGENEGHPRVEHDVTRNDSIVQMTDDSKNPANVMHIATSKESSEDLHSEFELFPQQTNIPLNNILPIRSTNSDIFVANPTPAVTESRISSVTPNILEFLGTSHINEKGADENVEARKSGLNLMHSNEHECPCRHRSHTSYKNAISKKSIDAMIKGVPKDAMVVNRHGNSPVYIIVGNEVNIPKNRPLKRQVPSELPDDLWPHGISIRNIERPKPKYEYDFVNGQYVRVRTNEHVHEPINTEPLNTRDTKDENTASAYDDLVGIGKTEIDESNLELATTEQDKPTENSPVTLQDESYEKKLFNDDAPLSYRQDNFFDLQNQKPHISQEAYPFLPYQENKNFENPIYPTYYEPTPIYIYVRTKK